MGGVLFSCESGQIMRIRKHASSKQNARQRLFAPGSFVLCSRLDRSDVLGLEPLGALHHVELHCLAFLQAAKAACLNSRKMYENIVARLAADEAEAFGVVKPFHCSLFHCVTCFYFKFLLRRIAAGDKGVSLVGGTDFQLLGESNLADMC